MKKAKNPKSMLDVGWYRPEHMTVFMNGKQKKVKRPSSIEGMNENTFIQRNADPIWLHQEEKWEVKPGFGRSYNESEDGP